MKILTFLKHNGIYGVGEIAGFDDDRADQLIAAGVAQEYTADAAAGDGGKGADTPAPAGKKAAADDASQGNAPAPKPPGDAGQGGDDATKSAGDAAASGAPPAQGKTA